MRFSRNVIVFALGLMVAPALAAPVSSDFAADADGWQMVDLAGTGNYGPGALIATYPVTWSATGGDPDGYISAPDPSDNSYFFQAPAKFLGDQSNSAGGALNFSLSSTNNNWSGDRVVVLVGNGGQTIVSEIAQPPVVDAWLQYSVPLNAANFRYSNQLGGVVSDGDFAAILGNLEILRLPAEFGTPVVETTSLDSVSLTPEPAALALLALGGVIVRRR